MIPIEALFVEEISGMAIIKIIDQRQKSLMMLKLKFIRNKAMLDITNNTRETVIFDKKTENRYIRFEIIRILQDKTGSIATKSK